MTRPSCVVAERSEKRGPISLADAPAQQQSASPSGPAPAGSGRKQYEPPGSFRDLSALLVRRQRFVFGAVGGLLAVCLLYCLFCPTIYEASAQVALRGTPASALDLSSGVDTTRSIAVTDTQLETLADMLRSDQVAWRVIVSERLYEKKEFAGSDFARRFPGFHADAPKPEAQACLLDRFQRRLFVRTLPRTLIVQIRFRSRDAALAATVVNELIHAYEEQQRDARVAATADATGALGEELRSLKSKVDADNQRLIAFQKVHGLVDTPETLPGGEPGETQHNATLVEIDALGQELVAAESDRIQRQTEYEASVHGSPEAALASYPRLQTQNAGFATAVLQRLHTQRSELEQEESRLRTAHGPNFPRVVEVRAQLMDIERQIKREDARLIAQFHEAWRAAANREHLVEQSLEASTRQGMQLNSAATEYAVMRQEADRNQELYLNVEAKAEEAGLVAGIGGSNMTVVDYARQPLHPVSPNWPVDLAITFFVGLWVAVGGALLLDASSSSRLQSTVAVGLVFLCMTAQGQAPTPSTSGLPSGVGHPPPAYDARPMPNAKDAPAVWGNGGWAIRRHRSTVRPFPWKRPLVPVTWWRPANIKRRSSILRCACPRSAR